MHKFGGIHCVLYALFDATGALNRADMKAQVEWILSKGVDGITVLGLATEVQKLSVTEQRAIIEWAAKDIAGKVPLSVTITGNSVAQQREMVSFALDRGADWLILQPPMAGAYSGDTYIDFFTKVAEGFDAPFSIQNAPQYLGRALSAEDVAKLTGRNPGFSLIKAETSAVDLAALIGRCGDSMTVLNGRGGLEMTDCLRAGAHGFVLAPDLIDHSKRVFDHWAAGDHDAADGSYAEILPAIVFMMQSIEHLICYGKRLFAQRAGLTIYDRQPAMQPTEFGIQLTTHWASSIDRSKGHEGGRETKQA